MGNIPYLTNNHNFFPDPNLVLVSEIIKEFQPDKPADAGIVGIPFDRGVISHRQGSRFAPKVVRELLADCTTYNLDLDVDIKDLHLVDCGDVDVSIVDYDETHSRIEKALTHLFKHGMAMVIIGGDHSASYPSIKALCNSMPDQKIGIIDFDSHYDIRSGWNRNAGLWAREVQELPGNQVNGSNIVQIGIHGFSYSRYYRDMITQMGISVVKPSEVRKYGMAKVMEKAITIASDGTDAIYISVDIDVMDPPYAPGTNDAPHGGLVPWQVIEGVVLAGLHPLTRAIDIMEISPPLDVNNITANLGAEIIMQFLSALALRKSTKVIF
jgi:formimidoylglutamase